VVLQLAHEVVKYHERQQELQRLKTVRIASTVASLVRDFWTRMIEASCTCLIGRCSVVSVYMTHVHVLFIDFLVVAHFDLSIAAYSVDQVNIVEYHTSGTHIAASYSSAATEALCFCFDPLGFCPCRQCFFHFTRILNRF